MLLKKYKFLIFLFLTISRKMNIVQINIAKGKCTFIPVESKFEGVRSTGKADGRSVGVAGLTSLIDGNSGE